MVTYILYIASALGAITTIIGFATYVSKPFRKFIFNIIKKGMRDDDQDDKLEEMNSKLNEISITLNLLIDSNISLIRDSITDAYYEYSDKGEIYNYKLESIMKQYSSYENLHGNSFVKSLYEKIEKLPVVIK